MSGNQFNRFALEDSPPVPRIEKVPGQKHAKLIYLSSDEDEDFEKVKAKTKSMTSTGSSDSSPWIDAYDHNALQRAMHKAADQKAQFQARTQNIRNASVLQNPIGKRDIAITKPDLSTFERNASPSVDLKSILHSKSSAAKKILDGDYDPIYEAMQRANQQKQMNREHRIQQREETIHSIATATTNIQPKRRRINLDSDEEDEGPKPPQPIQSSSSSSNVARKKVISLESDDESPVKKPVNVQYSEPVIEKKQKKKKEKRIIDSDEDEDYEGGWNEELTKAELKDKAANVIKQCEKVSKNLRQSLKEWEGGKSSTSTSDCINLTSIRSTSGTGVLSDADIAELCPGLVLNNYQLVGVNWLRLLYLNDVNGVLAGKEIIAKMIFFSSHFTFSYL